MTEPIEFAVVATSFEDLYLREYPGLIAVATALSGRDGEDLVQDAMVRALVSWEKVRRLERPGGWCHRVLVNLCRSRWRTTGDRSPVPVATEARRAVDAGTVGRRDGVLVGDSRTAGAAASRCRALFYAGDRSVADVAGILGVPEGTVRSDLSRARSFVLEPDGGAVMTNNTDPHAHDRCRQPDDAFETDGAHRGCRPCGDQRPATASLGCDPPADANRSFAARSSSAPPAVVVIVGLIVLNRPSEETIAPSDSPSTSTTSAPASTTTSSTTSTTIPAGPSLAYTLAGIDGLTAIDDPVATDAGGGQSLVVAWSAATGITDGYLALYETPDDLGAKRTGGRRHVGSHRRSRRPCATW